MRKAIDADPTSLAQQRRPVSDFYEAPVEGIRSAAKTFGVPSDDASSLPRIYSAVVQYHLGEIDRAERALERALAADRLSLAALIYRAQIEIDHKRYEQALSLAKRAMEVERQSAVAFYLVARAEEGLQKHEQARANYLAALERDPGLAPANARLGILAAEDDKESAKKWLLQALAFDPDNADARSALVKLGY